VPLLFGSSCVWGAEWSAQGNFGADLEHHDNLLLEGGDVEPVTGTTLRASGSLGYHTEVRDFSLAPRVAIRRYDSPEKLDANDYYVDLIYGTARETGNGTLIVNFANDSTLTSELETTGLVDARKRHELFGVQGSMGWAFTERDQLGVQVMGQDNHYRDAANTGLIDYSYVGAVASLTHAFSERTTFGGQLSGGALDPDSTVPRSRDFAARLTFSHQLAPEYKLDLEAGVSRTGNGVQTNDGTVYSINLQRSGELTDFKLLADQQVLPSGNGALVRRDDLALSMTHRFTQRLHAGATLRYLVNEDLQLGLPADNRHYQRAQVSLEWQVAQYWTVVASASGARQSFGDNTDTVHDLAYGIGLSWTPGPAAISR
jgi:hypothetical protein